MSAVSAAMGTTALITRNRSCPPDRSSVCRCLFGRPSEADTLATRQQYRRFESDQLDRKSAEYNFDFRRDMPRHPAPNDRFRWQRVSAAEGSQPCRRQDLSPPSSSSLLPPPSSEPAVEDRLRVPPASAAVEDSPAGLSVSQSHEQSPSNSSEDSSSTVSISRKRKAAMTGLIQTFNFK